MVKPDRNLTNQLLCEYKKTGSLETRNKLIVLFLPFVNTVSERIYSRLPHNIDLDDLKSAGLFGLMDAINGFDLTRGVQFETYCSIRIRGSILDELRALDWVPRVVRAKSQQLEKAYQDLRLNKGREPHDYEMAEYLKMTLEEYDDLVQEASITSILPLNNHSPQGEEEESCYEQIADRSQLEPYEEVFKKELLEYITRSLNQKERLVLILYYVEEFTMKEIGDTLLISESRISQIHSNLLLRLRVQFTKIKMELLS